MRFSLSSISPDPSKQPSTAMEKQKNLEDACYSKIKEIKEYMLTSFNVKFNAKSNAREYLQKQKLNIIKPIISRIDDLKDAFKACIHSYTVLNNVYRGKRCCKELYADKVLCMKKEKSEQ